MKKRVSPVLMGQKGSRRGLRRTQLHSLFLHGSITVAHTQAKQLARLVDRLICRVKGKEPVLANRYLLSHVASRSLASKIFAFQQQVKDKRNSGFTTITKLMPRRGDNHEQSIITLLDFVKKVKKTKEAKEVKKTKKNA